MDSTATIATKGRNASIVMGARVAGGKSRYMRLACKGQQSGGVLCRSGADRKHLVEAGSIEEGLIFRTESFSSLWSP